MAITQLSDGRIVEVLPQTVQTRDRRQIFENREIDLQGMKKELAGIDSQILEQQARDAGAEAAAQTAVIQAQIDQNISDLGSRQTLLQNRINEIETKLGL